ncbi:uncharacterized protein LOC132204605 [Neocloeon triangulifer]|uniref:uncharacterized protein LOC132204605 n=1 Tax=Neocloeon triangulifer TaxID=2078957 RepID=UPI00286F36CD|nr:uncharacterized protein LOC132204605 [Neocloeon triangulifer]
MSKETVSNLAIWIGGRTTSECKGKFAWCGLNEVLEDPFLTKRISNIKMANAAREMCLSLRFSSQQQLAFEVAPCDANLRYLCELKYRNAINFCCSQDMNLLSIETVSEFQCLLTLQDDPTVAGNHFWTSASSYNCHSSYVWCATENKAPFTEKMFWLPEELTYNQERKFALLYLAKSSTLSAKSNFWIDTFDGVLVKNKKSLCPISTSGDFNVTNGICSEKNIFVCEFPQSCYVECVNLAAMRLKMETEIREKNLICIQNACPLSSCTSTEVTAALLAQRQFPALNPPPEPACNTSFYVGKSIGDQQTVDSFCCSGRLSLATIQTEAKLKCMQNFLNRKKIFGSKRFWVSGRATKNCGGKYAWCGINEMLAKPEWISKSKINSDGCLTIYMNSNGVISLEPTYCKANHQYICEENFSEKVFWKESIGDEGADCVPKCVSCTSTINYNIPPNVIQTRTVCNKTYYFFFQKVNLVQASNICCSKDLTLLGLETMEEFNCILNLQFDPILKGNHFWTSASNFKCPNKYIWCGQDTYLEELSMWLPNELFYNQDEPNAVLYLSATTLASGLRRATAPDFHFFICEENETTDQADNSTEKTSETTQELSSTTKL